MRLTLTTLAALAALCVAGTAAAKNVYQESFHDEDTFVDPEFCGGPSVEIEYVIDGRFQLVPHGPSGLVYFLQHGKRTDRITNQANGKFVTTVFNVTEKDKHVTDNGDGTFTILVLATGNAVLYGADGKAIARDPGQTRYEILFGDGGTPDDPTDDVFEFLGVVKGSTGRSDDFCEAALQALS
jgi:hypothetical protein